MKNYVSRDKYKPAEPMEDGLYERTPVDGGSKAMLRGETNEMSQRPVSKTKKIRTDRGSFEAKC